MHYIFRDGQTYAIREGKVIAASADPDEVERLVREASPLMDANPNDPMGGPMEPRLDQMPPEAPQGSDPGCPGCGAPTDGARTNFCPHCGEPLDPIGMEGLGGQEMGNPYPQDEPSPGMEMGGEAGPYMAKVVTPNGVKGTVLGKVAGLWGEEVTIRLENGRIVKLPVGTELRAPKTASAKRVNPIERLEARLAATPDGTRGSLVARSEELQWIRKRASELIRDGVSYADSLRLDQLVVTAEVEGREIADAVAHLDDVESIAPPSFSMGVAHEAAGISKEDASWLDHVVDDMIKEAEATDFTKLMDEGPEALTAELPDVALADTGVTRQMASSFISEKTAGINREIAEPYMETFLARVEQCRRAELDNRKQTTKKEAAAEEDKYKDLPDEAFFL